MMIMGVCLVVISMFFYFASSESRMTYRYGNDTRALHIAEAGADLAINEWISFIDQSPPALGSTIKVQDYISQLASPKSALESKLSDYYGSGSVHIRYTNYNPNPPALLSSGSNLIVDIEGEYDGEVYPYQVKLSYSDDGNTLTYKGD